jgi:hypothetical protein
VCLCVQRDIEWMRKNARERSSDTGTGGGIPGRPFIGVVVGATVVGEVVGSCGSCGSCGWYDLQPMIQAASHVKEY